MPIQTGKRALLPDWMSESSVFDPLYKRVIRGAGNLIGINDPTSGLPTPAPLGSVVSTVGTEVEKRVAPKRAAKELADLLMGRSSRVPNAGLKPITDEEAKMTALLSGKVGGKPPKPTQLIVSPVNKTFNYMSRTLPRAPGITEAYRIDNKIKGTTPVKTVYVNTATPNQSVFHNPATKLANVGNNPFQTLAKESGSLQTVANKANLKVLTEPEMRRLIDGPKQAFKRGMINKAELEDILTKNQAKIDEYKSGLSKADQQNYTSKLNTTVSKNMGLIPRATDADELTTALRAGKAHGATEAELANKHGIPIGMLREILSRQF